MHLHMHTHIHIQETPHCLVALVKSQNQLCVGAVGLAALKYFKSRSDKITSAVPLPRAEEHLWRTRLLLMQTTVLCPIQLLVLLLPTIYFRFFY